MECYRGEISRESIPDLRGLFLPLMLKQELNESEFSSWVTTNWGERVLLIDQGKIIACGYFDHLYPGRWGSVHIAAEQRLNYFEVLPLCRRILRAWINDYDLKRIVAFIPVWNRFIKVLAEACGFGMEKKRLQIEKWVVTKETVR